ncbi:MAG: DUF4139 domain-containing protein [Desulfovibrionaceae bacterium]|nr:DUF4139 domain-containing protein [Desulfovibrionaceae bacterium]
MLLNNSIAAATIALCAIIVCPARADESRIFLYPDQAVLQKDMELSVHEGKIRFDLPASAEFSSLRISAEDNHILRWDSSLENGSCPIPDAARLQREIAENTLQQRKVAAEASSLRTRIAMWQSKHAEDLSRILAYPSMPAQLDNAIAPLLRSLYEELAEREYLLDSLKKQQRLLQEKLNVYGDVSVQRITAFPEKKSDSIKIRLTCNLKQAGWQSVYNLKAQTRQSAVQFLHEAVITQHSGMDWRNTDIILISSSPDSSPVPHALIPWKIRTSKEIPVEYAEVAAFENTPSPALMSRRNTSPQRVEQASGTTWNLGKRDIPAGSPLHIILEDQVWPAHFVRVLRPSVQTEAFLRADIDLPEPRTIHRSKALLFIDDTASGETFFSVSGRNALCWFGSDPYVTAEMNQKDQMRGQEGLIHSRNTWKWSWEIAVRNMHSTPADISVEDPAPQQDAESIRIAINSDPKPQKKQHTLIWNRHLEAGETFKIHHEVEASAPTTLLINPGRTEK